MDFIIDDLDCVFVVKEGEVLKDVCSGGVYNMIGGFVYGGVFLFNINLYNGGGKSKLGKVMKIGGLLFKGKGVGLL